MAIVKTEVCDLCPGNVPLVYDPMLGDRDAGPVEIKLPAGRHDMTL